MINNNLYALLIGVGDYTKMNSGNLPTYKMDLALLGTALTFKLKLAKENMRLMAGDDNNGFVPTADLARAISGFNKLLGEEDTFIFYFSGHGNKKSLVFSDGQVELQSLIDFVEKLPAKNKIVILDCCYSGDFTTAGAREMQFEESIADFAGHGIAVMASSAANEVSRFGPDGNGSVYTGLLSASIITNKNVHKGLLSLADINDEVQRMMKGWNEKNPEKVQHPIFRSSMGGTIYFPVEEYHPYKQKQFFKETRAYTIVSVKPVSSGKYKRLCAFIIPKSDVGLKEMAHITKEVARIIKYKKIYSTQAGENHFRGTPARAVWCYFGKDETDITNHNHFAYTIWAADDEMRKLYFGERKNAQVYKGIYIWENVSYEMIKKIQEPTMTRSEFIDVNKKLLVSIVSLAEKFIVDMQEVANQMMSIEEMQHKYSDWIKAVKIKYLKLTDLDVAPIDLHDWSAEIENLAGRILDMSILLENDKGNGVIGERELWLINHAISRYNESLEKLKKIEETIGFME